MTIPSKPIPIDWNRELGKKILEFEILNTGKITIPLSGALNLEDPQISKEPDLSVSVDVFAFLVRHPKFGDYLIDSGYDSSFGAEKGGKGNISGFLGSNYIKKTEQNPNQDIASQLNLRKAELKGVLLTHLHPDHTSGIPDLPLGVEYFTGKGEKEINIPFLHQNNHLDKVERIRELSCESGKDSPILGKVIDFFGDGSLYAVCTPGHSVGHLSFLVLTKKGPLFLTGDASHTEKGFRLGIEPGWVEDRNLAKQSLEKIIRFGKAFPSVKYIYGHEQGL